MRERLKEIAELTAAMRIVLLRQQSHVVAQRQQALEQRASFVVPSKQHIIVDKPEAASEEIAPSPGGRPSTSVPVS